MDPHDDEESHHDDNDPPMISLHDNETTSEAAAMVHFEIGNLEDDDDDEQDETPLESPQAAWPEQDLIHDTTVELHDVEAIVVAPCDLPEGYVLRVNLGNGRTLVTQVPFGGVAKGDVFSALYRIHVHSPLPKKRQDFFHMKQEEPVFGWRPATSQWNAKLYACCEFGPCHPSYLGACFCNCILLAQIMNRMNLNWYGRRLSTTGSRTSLARDTFTVVFLLFAAFYAVMILTDIISIQVLSKTDKQEEEEEEALQLLYGVTAIRFLVFCVFWTFCVLLITKTRRAIRDHYRIPGTTCNDACVACACHVCVLSQMARQSADYTRQPAKWCTDTGISENGFYDNVVENGNNEQQENVVIAPDISSMLRDENEENIPVTTNEGIV